MAMQTSPENIRPGIQFQPLKSSIDELETDLVVATLFSDERPPKGITGLLDWRLHGFISRRILDGSISGTLGEQVLLPMSHRLPARRLLVLGLGKKNDFTADRAVAVSADLVRCLEKLTVLDCLIAFPPSIDEKVSGDTLRSVLRELERAKLPENTLVRWLSSDQVER